MNKQPSDMRLMERPAAMWTVALLVAYLGYAYVFSPPPALEPDSWTFLELARSIFSDFYHIHTMRQYCIQTDYGVTYPPLWPLLIALYQAVFGGWLLSGVMLSRIMALLAVIPCLVLFWLLAEGESALQRGRAWYLALVVWMSLILNAHYMEEVNDGRSIPLTVLLYLCMACVAVRLHRATAPRARGRLAAVLGLLAGLAALTRFDSILLDGMSGLLLLAYQGRRAAAYYAAALMIAISPWIYYSWSHFHQLLVSDHRCVALASQYMHILYFNAHPFPTLFTAPLQWLQRVVIGAGLTVRHFLYVMAADLLTDVMLLAVVALWLARQPSQKSPRGAVPAIALLIVAMLAPIVLIASIAISRHYTAPVLLVTACCAVRLYRTRAKDQSVEMFILLGIVVGAAALAARPSGGSALPWNFAMVPLDDYHADLPCLPPDARIAMGTVSRERKDRDPFQFGYRTKLDTFVMPTNWQRLDTGDREAFVARYRISHVISSFPDLVPGMVPTRCLHVFTVRSP